MLPPEPESIRAVLGSVRPQEQAPAGRPYVFGNMIATADGRAALDGHTSSLGGDADLEQLLELRALADAVLIGTGTVRAEGYDRLVRSEERRAHRRALGLAEDPPAVLISRRFDVPWEAGLFQAAAQPVLIYTGPGGGKPPATAAPVEVIAVEDPAPAAVLADLRGRGVRALLCEGGPSLLRGLVAAGSLDELFLTIAPLLTADPGEPRVLDGGERLGSPRPLDLQWVFRAGSELFLRYRL